MIQHADSTVLRSTCTYYAHISVRTYIEWEVLRTYTTEHVAQESQICNPHESYHPTFKNLRMTVKLPVIESWKISKIIGSRTVAIKDLKSEPVR